MNRTVPSRFNLYIDLPQITVILTAFNAYFLPERYLTLMCVPHDGAVWAWGYLMLHRKLWKGGLGMNTIRRPRCFLVYALAPAGIAPAEANRLFNAYVAEESRGLSVYHDHFIGEPGGIAVFFVETAEQRAALTDLGPLEGWRVDVRPLIYAYSPAAFDEQTAYTLRAYRQADWERLRLEKRPQYGDPGKEAETAQEDLG